MNSNLQSAYLLLLWYNEIYGCLPNKDQLDSKHLRHLTAGYKIKLYHFDTPVSTYCYHLHIPSMQITILWNRDAQTFAVCWMLYVFFWVIPRRLNFICQRFGTLCLFHLHRRIGMILHTYPPIKMEQSIPKRRHIKFRRRGITHKKAYNRDAQIPSC
jgi:hypothetical protein